MLEELHVRDLALIEEAWLEPGRGMTALTGETGAGKTVLVGALQSLLGDRADSGAVRQGAAEALIEGRFSLGGREVTVRRRVSAEGRSKCYLDGEMATVGALGEALGEAVELHGQHDHQALLAPGSHAGFLDRFGGETARLALDAYRRAFSGLKQARQRLADLRSSLADGERQAEYLRFQISDIDAVGPRDGEDEELAAELPRMRHGEKLAEAASAAYRALRDEGAASDCAATALSALGSAMGVDPSLDAVADELAEAATLIDDLGTRLRDYGQSVDYDAGALNRAEGRLEALQTLKKKHGPTLADVLRARAEAEHKLEALDAGEEGLRAAESEVSEAERSLREAAGALREARSVAVPGFESGLREACADLAMPGSSFSVAVTELPLEDWTLAGPDRIEFLFSPGEGEAARPLARIASGGEISRVMLALKGVLGQADSASILVFDEIDAGIGGATALSVGRRLARLAEDKQVLVVTHLPQVAAFAGTHIVVEKAEGSGRTLTTTRVAAGEERVAEIARMLSGDVTEASVAHARELLESAGGTPAG